ncbi:MAG: cupin domain-containing protein [Bacteroidota bacterium]
MMKTSLLIVALWAGLSVAGHSQVVRNIADLEPSEPFENIHVQKLSSDERSTAFVIWVKNEVKAHKHAEHSEIVYVLEGEVEMTIGDKSYRVKPGDFIQIPKDTVHSARNLGQTPAKVLSVQAPAFFGKDRIFVE